MSAPLTATPETIASLKGIVTQTLSPDRATRNNAEQQIAELEKRPGFVQLLLTIVESEREQQEVLMGTALLFKNFVRKNWVPEDENQENAHLITANDRQLIKNHIVQLMCSLPPNMQSQMSEVVRIIAQSDFPEQWKNLLPDIKAQLANTQDFNIMGGVLELANTVFKPFRAMSSTQDQLKLKYVLTEFQVPLHELYERCTTMVRDNGDNMETLGHLLKILRTMSRIYYSLNSFTIPEYFEDNIERWHSYFEYLLTYENPKFSQQSDGMEESGPIEALKAAIIDNIKLYSEKYAEEFQDLKGKFTGIVWKLLQNLPREERFDLVTSKGLQYLTSLVTKPYNRDLFKEQSTLKSICEQIVIPNIMFRESDSERFEMNPTEYIQRDIEGSDNDTRRKNAVDLVKGMNRLFENEVTAMCIGYIEQLVASGDAVRQDAAITLLIGVSVRKSLRSRGVTEVNPNVPIFAVMDNLIIPQLKDANINANPILKADCLKFITTFRNQIPKEKMATLFPFFVEYLKSTSYVVHSYAAVAIERTLFVKEDPVGAGPALPRYSAADISAHLTPLFTNIFTQLENPEYSDNEYLARALMRVIVVSKETLIPITELLINKLQGVLARVCKEPKNPTFNHYLFESVAALIKYVCSSNPAAVAKFEELLFPPFTQILQMEISEFTPYVYQIMAQMLELGPKDQISEAYMAIFGSLYHPQLYANAGNVPGICRLLEGYMEKKPMETVGTNLEGFFGTVAHLLNRRASQDLAYKLLVALVEFVPPSSFQSFLPTLLPMLFKRWQVAKNTAEGMCLFVMVFIGKHGPGPVISVFEGIQKNLFVDSFLASIVVPNVAKTVSPAARKACAVGLTRLLCESNEVIGHAKAWAAVMEATVNLLSVATGEKKTASEEEYLETMAESGYSSSFSRLAYSQTQKRDHFKEIPNTKAFFVQRIQATQAIQPLLNSLSPQVKEKVMAFSSA